MPYALQLLPLSDQPVLQHFGLHLLEHCLRHRWNQLDKQQQATLKKSVMELMAAVRTSNGWLFTSAECSTSKLRQREASDSSGGDCKARVASTMARTTTHVVSVGTTRSMNTEMLSVTVPQRHQLETSVMVLRSLLEEVKQGREGGWTGQRKQDILATLKENAGTIVAFLQSLLMHNMTAYLQARSDAGQKLLQIILEAINAYVEWIPMRYTLMQICLTW